MNPLHNKWESRRIDEEFDDTKWGIRIRKSKKDRQQNGKRKKNQKDKQRSTKHTQKTKNRVIRIPLKTWCKLSCSGRVIISRK